MTYEVDLYEGYGSLAWSSVATGCFFFLLKLFWNDLSNFTVAGTNFCRAFVFHIFWMEGLRLASTLLLPRLWHKARGRYPSPEVRVHFNTQLLSLLISCALLHNNLGIILSWRTTPPFLVPTETTENFKLTGVKMQWTCWLTLAYMIHDTMHMLMTWKFTKNKLMLLHHISFTIISNSGGRILGDPASLLTFEVDDCIIITLIFSFMESSTIFLNTRWLIAIVLCKGQPKSKFLKLFLTVNEFLFLGCFVFFRIFLFSGIIALAIWRYNDNYKERNRQPAFLSAIGMAYALNWYWAYYSISVMNRTRIKNAKQQ